MIRTKDKQVIQKLMSMDKIATANAVGRINNENNWEIIVDSLENPQGFILQSGYWNVVYSPRDEIAEKMISEIDFCKKRGFAGVLKKYYEIVKKFNKVSWEEHCYLYYLEESSLDISRVNHVVKPLSVKHAGVVNEYYTYKDDDSLDYLTECIQKRPSSAVFNEDGQPVSWALVREDGSMGVMYTKREYRGKGLAVSVTIDLAQKVFNSDGIPYVHIVTENNPSIALAESIGFKRYGEIVWFGVD